MKSQGQAHSPLCYSNFISAWHSSSNSGSSNSSSFSLRSECILQRRSLSPSQSQHRKVKWFAQATQIISARARNRIEVSWVPTHCSMTPYPELFTTFYKGWIWSSIAGHGGGKEEDTWPFWSICSELPKRKLSNRKSNQRSNHPTTHFGLGRQQVAVSPNTFSWKKELTVCLSATEPHPHLYQSWLLDRTSFLHCCNFSTNRHNLQKHCYSVFWPRFTLGMPCSWIFPSSRLLSLEISSNKWKSEDALNTSHSPTRHCDYALDCKALPMIFKWCIGEVNCCSLLPIPGITMPK